jgi:hypothetical protein
MTHTPSVIPADAGISGGWRATHRKKMPAFDGRTERAAQ